MARKSLLDATEIAQVQRETARFINEVVPGFADDVVYYYDLPDRYPDQQSLLVLFDANRWFISI